MTTQEIEKLIGDAAEEGNIEKVRLLSHLFPIEADDLEGMRIVLNDQDFDRFFEEMKTLREQKATEARIKLQAMGMAV